MPRFCDDRAPLESTKVKASTMLVVCPYCKGAKTVKTQTVGLICPGCKKYYNISNSLDENQAVDLLDVIFSPNKEFIKLKEKTEKQAYDWREKQMQKRKSGDVPSHEPGGVAPDWRNS